MLQWVPLCFGGREVKLLPRTNLGTWSALQFSIHRICIPLIWIISKPHSFCFEAACIGKIWQNGFNMFLQSWASVILSWIFFKLIFPDRLSCARWVPWFVYWKVVTCRTCCYPCNSRGHGPTSSMFVDHNRHINDVFFFYTFFEICIPANDLFKLRSRLVKIHTVSPEGWHIAEASNANCGSPAQMTVMTGSKARSNGVKEGRCFRLGGSKSLE